MSSPKPCSWRLASTALIPEIATRLAELIKAVSPYRSVAPQRELGRQNLVCAQAPANLHGVPFGRVVLADPRYRSSGEWSRLHPSQISSGECARLHPSQISSKLFPRPSTSEILRESERCQGNVMVKTKLSRHA